MSRVVKATYIVEIPDEMSESNFDDIIADRIENISGCSVIEALEHVPAPEYEAGR